MTNRENEWQEIATVYGKAIERVRELHKPQETMVKPYQVEIICRWCSSDPKYVVYPCQTIKALDGEQ